MRLIAHYSYNYVCVIESKILQGVFYFGRMVQLIVEYNKTQHYTIRQFIHPIITSKAKWLPNYNDPSY